MRLAELLTAPKWASRLHCVLRDLPEELVGYKGLTRYRPTVVEYLSRYDDGTPTSLGFGPE